MQYMNARQDMTNIMMSSQASIRKGRFWWQKRRWLADLYIFAHFLNCQMIYLCLNRFWWNNLFIFHDLKHLPDLGGSLPASVSSIPFLSAHSTSFSPPTKALPSAAVVKSPIWYAVCSRFPPPVTDLPAPFSTWNSPWWAPFLLNINDMAMISAWRSDF